MKRSIAYEWVRLTSLRSTWVLTVASLLIAVLAALAFTFATGGGSGGPPGSQGDQAAYATVLTAGAQLTPLLMGLLGAFAFGHEYRYGTIRPTLTALPRRGAVAAAKVLLVVVWSAAVAALAVALAVLVAELFGGDRFEPGVGLSVGATPRVALGVVLYVVLSALVGLAFGWLFRNIVAAVSLLLVMPIVVEPLLKLVLSLDALEPVASVGRFLPFTAGAQLYAYSTAIDPDIPEAFRNDLSPLAGGLTFAALALVLLAAAYALFQRRDA